MVLTICQVSDNLSVPQVFLKRVAIRFFFMRYATTSSNDIYHLLTPAENKTLCGLDVVPIVINRPTSSSTLYLTEIVESDRQVCERCAAIRAKAENSFI